MPDMQKQTVQWFPGHMAKTRRLISESLPEVDAVTELLDARIPESSRNPELGELIGKKPKLVLLNKCDLADERTTAAWLAYYKARGIAALAVDCRSGRGLQQYRKTVAAVLRDTVRRNEERGMPGKALRIMVVGIPNTGKSSFINRMAGAAKAKTEDRAGVTRRNQWFFIGGGIELLDTPGVLWPKFDDPAVGDKLAFTGGVKDDVLDMETLALRLCALLQRDYPDRLAERFGLPLFETKEPWALLEAIARRRGMLVSGGEADTERASVMLLDELRGGKLGRLSFEKPEETL